jgi:6-phosphogluconolactonase (cycloisomerase 2 family)
VASALLALLAVTVAGPIALSAPSGRVVQPAGAQGCVNNDGSEGCTPRASVANGDGAISRDGRNVYVVATQPNTSGAILTVFSRDQATGVLTAIGETQTRGIGAAASFGDAPIVLSPDGRFLYVGTPAVVRPGAIAIFARDTATGELSQVECINAQGTDGCRPDRAVLGAGTLAISPNGRQLYAIVDSQEHGPSIRTFDRDPATGTLARRHDAGGCIAGAAIQGCAHIHGPFPYAALALSPDGRALIGVGGDPACLGEQCFVDGGGSLSVFTRSRDGSLRQLPGQRGCIAWQRARHCAHARAIETATAAVFSPDGRSVYVAAFGFASDHDAIATFVRNPRTGTLRQPAGAAGCVAKRRVEHCAVGRALDNPLALAVSADGRNVYSAANMSDGLGAFRRSRRNGPLAQLPGRAGCHTSSGPTCARGRGLRGLQHVLVSPDNRNVYGLGITALVAFGRVR